MASAVNVEGELLTQVVGGAEGKNRNEYSMGRKSRYWTEIIHPRAL